MASQGCVVQERLLRRGPRLQRRDGEDGCVAELTKLDASSEIPKGPGREPAAPPRCLTFGEF